MIGAITALFMGFLGVIQNDIKRVVAYSTLSQLGYMTVALGASAYSAAIFHLMTHAFFKALLFLGAGSVIIGMHHDQDIRNMGGLRKYMPITWITSLIGSLALIGTPFFSGFYSKDSIIEAVGSRTSPGRASRTSRSWRACSSPRCIRSACSSWCSTARSASVSRTITITHAPHRTRSRRADRADARTSITRTSARTTTSTRHEPARTTHEARVPARRTQRRHDAHDEHHGLPARSRTKPAGWSGCR